MEIQCYYPLKFILVNFLKNNCVFNFLPLYGKHTGQVMLSLKICHPENIISRCYCSFFQKKADHDE